MRASNDFNIKRRFRRALFASLTLHLITLGLIFWFSEWERRSPPPLKVTWVRLGGGVGKEEGLPFKEVKTLPQTTIEEQKKASFEQPPLPKEKPPAKEEKKPVGLEKEKVVVEGKTQKPKKPETPSAEKKPDGARDRRIQDALAKINEDLKEPSPLPEAAQVKSGGPGDPHGSPGGSDAECARYSARVKQRVVGNWVRMVGSNRPPRPPVIFARINASGQLLGTQFTQRSGDQGLDMSALRAMQSSSPFPPPPTDCQAALTGGITVQFGR